ncbi:MAG: T9SS type A sorting domain-containing protein [Ignavibacteriae bacterium]|nr:T9SS C-terminal target domain-containing protein [Ignavibacteriota bacterium]NOG99546.1 T9SS type A sorting domain-containing protein [Ignavibacteriota bacterium]
MKQLILLFLIGIFSLTISSNAQLQHFTNPGYTGEAYTVVIQSSTIDGISLEIGDEIAVFDEGPNGLGINAAVVFNGIYPIQITTNLESSVPGGITLPGAIPGNPISFRIWDSSTDEEYETGSIILVGPTFGVELFSIVELVYAHKTSTAVQNVSGTGIYQFNSEQTGVEIVVNSLAGSGDITVSRYLGNQPSPTTGITPGHFISTYYWVIEADQNISSIECQLRFYISEIPNPGIAEDQSDILLWHRDTPGTGAFTQYIGNMVYVNGSTTGDLSDDYLFMDGITSFSELVFSSETPPLPVELSSFTAICADNVVELNWRTETELNNYGFEIERTIENSEWETIGFVEGIGTSNKPVEYQFTDKSIFGKKLFYRLKQIDNDGSFEYSKTIAVEINQTPAKFTLEQNYPNPFNPITSISYTLIENGYVKLSVFNISGEEIAVLVNEEKAADIYDIEFNGEGLTSGVYFYKIETPSHFAVKKMLILK